MLGVTESRRTMTSRTITAIQLAIGLALVWQIATRSVPAALWQTAPDWALALAPENSSARLQLAEWKLGQGSGGQPPPGYAAPLQDSSESKAQINAILVRGVPAPMVPPDISAQDRTFVRQLATLAWLSQPLNARGPRLLGQIAATNVEAAALMAKARTLSMHEPLANYWLLQAAFLASDFPGTLAHADVLLRAQPDIYPVVVPVLARIAENPAAAPALATVLRGNPPWRAAFFQAVVNSVFRPGTISDLLLALQPTTAPPTPAEVNPFLAYLVKSRLYGPARSLWQRMSPANSPARDQLLFDGSFAAAPSPTPFDWRLQPGAGMRLAIAAAPDKAGQNGLRLEFLEQTVAPLEIGQTVVLGPGNYIFSGLAKGDFRARKGLRWQVACIERPYTPIATSPLLNGNPAGWREFKFAFAVPASDCAAQQISLDLFAISESERIAAGTAWFTGLDIHAQP